MPKISVIIPVYNVEEYLAKCLDSVCNQTFKDIEILCVNDCSPDDSFVILEDYVQKDNRIKIINREKNGGLSAARNSGLEKAQGEYIYFIDSDDWIDLDYLEKMYNAAIEHNVEIIQNNNIVKIDETKKTDLVLYKPYKEQNKKGEYLQSTYSIVNTFPMTWCHLYKRAFLEKYNFRFPEGYIHEDEYFKRVTELYVEKIFVFFGPTYYYFQRAASIMNSRSNPLLNRIKIYSIIWIYCVENKLTDRVDNTFIPLRNEILTSEEEYDEYKKFLSSFHLILKKYKDKYDDLELFLANIILKTENFKEYSTKFLVGKDMRLLLLRYKREFLND